MLKLLLTLVFLIPLSISADDNIVSQTESSAEILSTDIEVTIAEPITPNWLMSAACSGERFVAVGEQGTLLYSDDGLHWDSLFCSFPLNFYDITWTGTQFIALGHDNQFPWPSIVLSRDGHYWRNAKTVPFSSEGLYSIAYSGYKYVAVGHGGQVFGSFDGENWQVDIQPSDIRAVNFYSVIWADPYYIAAGEIWDADSHMWSGLIAYSDDGLSWDYRPVDGTSLLFDLVKFRDIVAAVGYRGAWGEGEAVVVTSPDFMNWRIEEFSDANYLRTAAVMDDCIVAAGDDGLLVVSPDGKNWERLMHDSKEALTGIASSNSKAVVVGTSGTVICARLLKPATTP